MKHRVVSQLMSECADVLQKEMTEWKDLKCYIAQRCKYHLINEMKWKWVLIRKKSLDCGALDLETYKHEK